MTATILIVEDEEYARDNYAAFLTSKGYEVVPVATLADARKCIRKGNADIVVLDVQLPDGYGPSLLEENFDLPYRPQFILITGVGNIQMAVEAMMNGATDFLEKPIQFAQLERSIQRAAQTVALNRELAHLRSAQNLSRNFVIGQSPTIQSLLVVAQRVAITLTSVLITGETGTGKEVLAHALHQMGPRANKPFIAINSGAIQNTLLEAELFGHEPGAYSSAEKRKPGLMEIADGGILFLDEISTMPLDMQAKLLRALDERAFRRVGGVNMIHVDVQILAASNRNLMDLISQGNFREDLYYRLKVVNLHLPPLRERREDIPELVAFIIHENNPRLGLNILDVTPRALQAMVNYNWPGNIRELRNVIERAMIFCYDAVIDLPHLPRELTQNT